MNLSIRSRTCVTLVAWAVALCSASVGLQAQQRLTFSIRFENKLFISTIPPAACGAAAVLGPGAGRVRTAAFMTFCQATSLAENPPTPAIVAPLDARIRGGIDVQWQCQVGNPIPVGQGNMARLATAGGNEGPPALGIKGVVNPIATRNNILANGSFGYVLSGRPNAVVEPAFQLFRARATTDIWNRVTGVISCGVDTRGLPTATVNTTLLATLFPSHKLWYRTPMAAPAPILLFNMAQGAFSNLWFLPPVPAP